MSWFGPALTEDQREVVDLVRATTDALPPLEDESTGAERADVVAEARDVLVESGVWSIGIDDGLGGGGAPAELVQTAFVALGSAAPALAWASAQAHAAAAVLADDPGVAELVETIVAGTQPVCVVERHAPHVRLELESGRAMGEIDRLDPAGERPVVVVLDEERVWVLLPAALRARGTLRRTGLAGALTTGAVVDTGPDGIRLVAGAHAATARRILHAAGAAIAAGIAAAAAEGSIGYSGEREQFGAALTALPTVRASLAAQAAGAADAARRALADGDDETVADALARNCDVAIEIAASAVQSRGGYGYLRESGVERLVRDAVSLRAATGAGFARRGLADRFAPV